MSSQMWRVAYSASKVRALFLKLSLAGSTNLPTVSQPWRPETRNDIHRLERIMRPPRWRGKFLSLHQFRITQECTSRQLRHGPVNPWQHNVGWARCFATAHR
ncbi:hypothetical protein BGZ61DRAFT_4115 [Ilyonectria robusta]|uniref:uncharacterized protein n=1 Tax=Ilyonectria robusta TaxID=1079257 RepID=UPI001E8CBC00|nr:uncharacterized protein BGZ61DRAFT_4115 [Ilyonectria robusta]KAH8736837.1 hypothetical protein BGZ61DRAFT_4115 [Ilyonectria robusta]